jgi:Tol biopolymer transport system component
MRLHSRIFITALLLAAALLACALPGAPSQINDAATAVAQTMQALVPSTAAASPLPSPAPGNAATNTTAPQATASPSAASPSTTSASNSNPLPHSLYFLNNDSGGLLQIFRIERDGHTVHQITFEPAAVDRYDLSPIDGSVVYASNNQLLLVDSNGAGRRLLLDGGPLDDNNRFTNGVGMPVWSPDGQTIAFNHGGLNFYSISTGAVSRVLENQIDTSSGFPVVRELYAPVKYAPDGSKLLISIGFYEGGTYGIYIPANNTLVRFKRPDGANICCQLDWVPDGSGLYASSSTIGLIDSGLWYVNPTDGSVATLLVGSAPDGTYNFAAAPQVGPDGKLYYFFNNLPAIPANGHTPLVLVRSGSDGATGRQQLKPDVFDNTNEILWAPDASLAVVVFAPTQDIFQGGRAEIVYPDARPNILLVPFAEELHWGP